MHYHNLGDVLIDLGEYRKAGEAAIGAADIIPGCPIGANRATQIYARCVAQLQDRAPLKPPEDKSLKKEYVDRTLPLVDRIITSGRGNPTLENAAAWHLATFPDDRVRNPGRAAVLAEKVVERIPRSGSMWNTLGVARYRKGDWKGAVKALGKATELDKGKDPADGFFLAMAQWQLGHKDEARACYKRAAKIHGKGFITDEEFRRFRDEAKTLLGVKD
jgi:tetratricopeptide (TPR) repeat protein